MEGDQVYSVPTFRYYSSNQDKAKFLTSNVQADILARQAELNEHVKTIGQLQQQKVKIDADIQQNVREERKSETQLMKIREAKRKASMEMGELKNIEDPTPVDVSTLEEEVVVLENQLKEQLDHVTEKRAVYQEQDTKLIEIDKTYKDIQQRMMQKLQAGDAIESEVASIVNEVEVSKGHKKHYDGQLKQHDDKVQELKQKLEKHKQDVDVKHSQRMNDTPLQPWIVTEKDGNH